ncbi:MAG: SDR family oxidoreductase [Propionicimonas sp.]|nr:SDR family oxidoreductase [Propionicimonas sp.]
MNTTDTNGAGIALITGASAGIGQSAAVEVARKGMGVVLTYPAHRAGADEAVATIRQEGGTAVALPLDVGRVDAFDGFVAELRRVLAETWQAGSLRGLVNNAGFGGGVAFAEITQESFDQYHRVLFKGPYFLTQALLPLLEDGASIVNTGSSSIRPGDTEPGYSAYAAMKAGLVVASRFLARELSPRGIRVNTIAPGPTRTRLGGDAFARFPELIEPLAARTALGRIGEPEDIGKVIAFLLSPEAGWITGQDLQVTGGYLL